MRNPLDQFALPIDAGAGPAQPLFLRIARALVDEVRRGRLRPGDPVPGSRELARTIGVHRNTVLAAYRELLAEGWLVTEPARGTFVSRALPDVAPRRFAASGGARAGDEPGFDLPPLRADEPDDGPAVKKGALSLSGGVPDVRLVPAEALARAYRRALRGPGAAGVLGYGDAQGDPRLRSALAQMLAAGRGLAHGEDGVLVTRGSQMAIDLAARALLRPGDVVAVESLGYRPAWEALRASGARLVPVRVDADGLVVDDLAALAGKERVRAVYVTPHHQYPTTVALAPGRRIELLALARRERMLVIEDDYDHEFHYEGRPLLPLASADEGNVVVYVGTLSKVLAPGVRVGFAVAPAPVIARITSRRRFVDRQGDHAVERALAELLEDGEVQRHVRRARRIYAARRDALIATLERALPGVLSFEVPAGGTALWARAAPDIDVDAWAERAGELGVLVHTARRFAFDGRRRPWIRLGFAALTEPEMAEAVRRLVRAAGSSGSVRNRAGVTRVDQRQR